jgi:HEAT repeat protein
MWLLVAGGAFRSGPAALRAFLDTTDARGESELSGPLAATGNRAVPAVVTAIRDPSLRYRRYAIAYLGWAGDSQAIPALLQILEDTSEIDYFRGDALEAIACLHRPLGDSLARANSDAAGDLGSAVRQIGDGPFCPDLGFSPMLAVQRLF